ncbi:hypothetical protein SNE40_012163 [Patella caerulea]
MNGDKEDTSKNTHETQSDTNNTESNQVPIPTIEFQTPPQMPVLQHPVHVRTAHDRPVSAHQHRMTISGQLLRAMGDQYQCHTCGRVLRTIGDELSGMYAIRRAASSNDLPNYDQNPAT